MIPSSPFGPLEKFVYNVVRGILDPKYSNSIWFTGATYKTHPDGQWDLIPHPERGSMIATTATVAAMVLDQVEATFPMAHFSHATWRGELTFRVVREVAETIGGLRVIEGRYFWQIERTCN